MDIHTVEQLNQVLYAEIAWRKKELIQFRTLIGAKENPDQQPALIRAGITLLYAHWEGFVKNAGTAYLEFVARRRLRYNQLAPNFVAIALRRLLGGTQTTAKSTTLTKVVDFFLNDLSQNADIPWKSAINTRANLKSEVFRQIINILGLDYSIYETKERFIDEKLLRNRNEIAHGKFLQVDFKEYLEIHREILSLIDLFQTQIDKAASKGSFRRN